MNALSGEMKYTGKYSSFLLESNYVTSICQHFFVKLKSNYYALQTKHLKQIVLLHTYFWHCSAFAQMRLLNFFI